MASAMPGLLPQHCDVGAPSCPEGTILIDCADALGQLLQGKRGRKEGDGWNPKWRGHLASAVSGGQWPQTRKAAVPRWHIVDKNCQLCHQEVGTLEHRFRCPKTCPPEGWPEPPEQASLALDRLLRDRRRLLQTRAMLVLRVPRPPLERSEWFTWYLEPPVISNDCTWYLDGSMFDGKWIDFRAVGFAIVVVSDSHELLGYGHGCPPLWCNTAAAAEAWALSMALMLCPFPPRMKTDCLSLLRTAEGGLASATASSRPLARIWCRIGNAMDGNIGSLAADDLLVWMPAHQTTAAIGARILSNGELLSAIDWRANRLVDALAKQAAAHRQAPRAITRLLASARLAVRHAASLLGQVTHAANNCRIEVAQPDGSFEHRTCRDAQQHTGQRRNARRQRPLPAPSLPVQLLPASAGQEPRQHCKEGRGCKRTATQAALQAGRRAKAARAEKARSAAAAEVHVQRLVEEASSRLTVPAGRLSASERLQRVHERVRARAAEKSGILA